MATTTALQVPTQLTRQEVDDLYILTALLAPYTSEKEVLTSP